MCVRELRVESEKFTFIIARTHAYCNLLLTQDLVLLSNCNNLQTATKRHSLTQVHSFTINYNMAHYKQKLSVRVRVRARPQLCKCVGLLLLALRKHASEIR